MTSQRLSSIQVWAFVCTLLKWTSCNPKGITTIKLIKFSFIELKRNISGEHAKGRNKTTSVDLAWNKITTSTSTVEIECVEIQLENLKASTFK